MSVTPPVFERRQRQDRRKGDAYPLGQDLAAAIERDEVELLFQPQFSSANGALTGAEALVRWTRPTHEIVFGDELFRIAARAGLSQTLSRHVLAAALAEAKTWPDDLRLSINVTADDLAAPDFVESVVSALERVGFPANRLTLEITEQALVEDLAGSSTKLARLAEHRVCAALDDFGAGFCNFGYLKALPLHYLKLDRSMVHGITEDQRDLDVLRGIIAMAKALDLGVIAEGVETAAQRDAIIREGCAIWQGYLGAKSLSAKDFLHFVSSV